MYRFDDAVLYHVTRGDERRTFESVVDTKAYLLPGDKIVLEFEDGTTEPWHTEPPTWTGTPYDLVIDGPRRHP